MDTVNRELAHQALIAANRKRVELMYDTHGLFDPGRSDIAQREYENLVSSIWANSLLPYHDFRRWCEKTFELPD